jgi:hypothetical protein
MTNRGFLGALAVVVAMLTPAGSGWAQGPVRQIESDNTGYGTTAAEFLLFPAASRGAALGNAFAAIATDASAVYFNPSGLALMERPTVQASTMSYVADTRYGWIAAGFPFGGGARAVGVSVATFGFGDQPVYTVEDPEGESGEVYSVNQTAIGLTYAQRFSDRFAAGVTARLISDQLGRVVGRAGALDFGTTFTASVGGRPIRAAFVVQNLGTNLKHSGNALDVAVEREPPLGEQEVPQEPATGELKAKGWSLPAMFRVAVGYDAFATSLSRFTVLGEFNQPNNSDPGFNFAGEYSLTLGTSGFTAAGRIGFTYAPDNNLGPPGASSAEYAGFESSVGGEAMDGFSVGGGVRWAKRAFGLSFDYAYRDLGLLGGVSMVTVGISW